ncbi:hypothetical protein ACJX0J_002769 [Zea mays]
MLSIACVDQFLVAFSLVDSYFSDCPVIQNLSCRYWISFHFPISQQQLPSSAISRFQIVWRNGSFIFLWNKKNSSILFLFCNIIFEPNVLIVGYPSDMYISKRFSSEVKSTKVTQKMDKIVSVTNKNIYRESLLTSSKLENFIKIKYFVFLFNEYQAWINYTRNPGFKEKRYGLDCIETQRKRIGAETQWKLIIVNLFQSNIEESPILHCDKNSMNLMLFIK